MSDSFLVCGSKSWNRRAFNERIRKLPGTWHFIAAKEELTKKTLDRRKPRTVFFLHWSWKVPAEIFTNFECINFHMTDLPYGRGGSPLQNLILRGHTRTKITAFRMNDEMDAGPVYGKEPLSLKGTVQEILVRSSEVAARMIARIVKERPVPVAQRGRPVLFTRRKPDQSRLPDRLSLRKSYDFIRMLDGEGYPPAFVDYRRKRYELTNAVLYDNRLEAKATPVPSPA